MEVVDEDGGGSDDAEGDIDSNSSIWSDTWYIYCRFLLIPFNKATSVTLCLSLCAAICHFLSI